MTEKTPSKRTNSQNAALHLFFELLSQECQAKGVDMRAITEELSRYYGLPATKTSIKEFLWKPIQHALYQKTSTTELLKQQEIDRVYAILKKIFAERWPGVDFPRFPSVEEAIMAERLKTQPRGN